MVSVATMDAVVTAILDHTNAFAGEVWTDRPAVERQAGSIIGNKLFAMNSRALRACYGADDEKAKIVPFYTFARRDDLSEVQRLKCIDCLVYQCMEGDDVPDEDLYRELVSIQSIIAMWVVSHSREYRNRAGIC
jgi:hypothetical protein